ncbi:hypothetical protein QBC38DRAFT_474579 [Podospora fimiseda]|uniref:NACHT domain-containing protein n=1 Tax=Podospora fimiseda TaxID=252190 RepID=A0AAN7H1K4_9PEZI|nr:hypothetical protein QBC38DRAFT_474579 [Podospora fimiseda]
MADAFSIIGVTAALIDLTIHAGKVVRIAYSIYKSGTKSSTEDDRLEDFTTKLVHVLDKLKDNSAIQGSHDANFVSLVDHSKKLGQEVLDLLNAAKPMAGNSIRESIRSTVATIWNEKKIEDLKKELEYCTIQLQVHIQTAMGAEMGVKMDQVLMQNDWASEQLSKIKIALNLANSKQKATLDIFDQLKEVLQLSEAYLVKANQQRILEGIRFEDMEARFESISNAAKDTYHWCLESSEPPESHPNLKISFRNWLAGGSGVFHIAGKPGAGKSTLMKFLADHEETRKQLQRWAGRSKALVLASFYFWRAGSKNQTSLEGLIRSIAHSIFSKLPHLIPKLFKDHWNPGEIPLRGLAVKIRFDTIFNALDTVFQRKIDMEDCAFCLFIDGLDEFNDPTKKHSMLARDLSSWAETNSSGLKICVSSRQESAFMNNFADEQRIYLHLLTKPDMDLAVRNFLGQHQNFVAEPVQTQQKLINTIVDRGEGVFLWVKLVLDEIWEALDDGLNFDEIYDLLDIFPDELEDFFGYMLSSIRAGNRREGWAILAILAARTHVKNQETEGLRMPLLQFTFVDDYLHNNQFGITMQQMPPKGDWAQKIEPRMLKFISRLSGLCKGLVDARRPDNNHPFGQLDFLHRSVYDYLQSGSLPRKFVELRQDLGLESFIIQSAIAIAKLLPLLPATNSYKYLEQSYAIFEASLEWVQNRSQYLREEHFQYLDQLNSVLLERQLTSPNFKDIDWDRFRTYGSRTLNDDGKDKNKFFYLLSHACTIEFVEYVKWTFEKYPQIQYDTPTLARLVGEAMWFGKRNEQHEGETNLTYSPRSGQVLEFFITQSWFTPQLRVPITIPISTHPFVQVSSQMNMGNEFIPAMISFCIRHFLLRSKKQIKIDPRGPRWKLFKLLLQKSNDGWPVNFEWSLVLLEDQRQRFRFLGENQEQYSLDLMLLSYQVLFMESKFGIMDRGRLDEVKFSLRWLVEQIEGNHKYEALELIDRNTKLFKPTDPRAQKNRRRGRPAQRRVGGRVIRTTYKWKQNHGRASEAFLSKRGSGSSLQEGDQERAEDECAEVIMSMPSDGKHESPNQEKNQLEPEKVSDGSYDSEHRHRISDALMESDTSHTSSHPTHQIHREDKTQSSWVVSSLLVTDLDSHKHNPLASDKSHDKQKTEQQKDNANTQSSLALPPPGQKSFIKSGKALIVQGLKSVKTWTKRRKEKVANGTTKE